MNQKKKNNQIHSNENIGSPNNLNVSSSFAAVFSCENIFGEDLIFRPFGEKFQRIFPVFTNAAFNV